MGQDLQAVRGARYELFSMLSSAASAGLGVALIPEIMLSGELESGRLQVAIDQPLASASGYYLVAPEETDAYLALAQWLMSVAPEGAAAP